MKKLNIYLSPIAETQFEELCNYLAVEWSEKSKKKFIERLDRKFNQISTQPNSCPESEIIHEVRKAVVDKKNIIFIQS